MLLLAATTDKIQVLTSAAVTVDVHSSFMDISNADPPVVKGSTSGKQNTAITTATTTDVVAAPAASTIRNVKTLNVRNKSASSTVDVTVIYNQNATLFELHKATLSPGEALEYVEGVGWYEVAASQAAIFKVLTADDAGGQNVATVQPWFPTAGAVTLQPGTYKMDGHLYLTRAAGAVSHTTSTLFGGTATYTLQYIAKVQVGDTEALLPLSRVVSRVATATVVKAASTATTEAISIDLEGIIRVTVAGTVIPQFIYSAAPGGAPTIKANSNFMFTPLGDAAILSSGTWS